MRVEGRTNEKTFPGFEHLAELVINPVLDEISEMSLSSDAQGTKLTDNSVVARMVLFSPATTLRSDVLPESYVGQRRHNMHEQMALTRARNS